MKKFKLCMFASMIGLFSAASISTNAKFVVNEKFPYFYKQSQGFFDGIQLFESIDDDEKDPIIFYKMRRVKKELKETSKDRKSDCCFEYLSKDSEYFESLKKYDFYSFRLSELVKKSKNNNFFIYLLGLYDMAKLNKGVLPEEIARKGQELLNDNPLDNFSNFYNGSKSCKGADLQSRCAKKAYGKLMNDIKEINKNLKEISIQKNNQETISEIQKDPLNFFDEEDWLDEEEKDRQKMLAESEKIKNIIQIQNKEKECLDCYHKKIFEIQNLKMFGDDNVGKYNNSFLKFDSNLNSIKKLYNNLSKEFIITHGTEKDYPLSTIESFNNLKTLGTKARGATSHDDDILQNQDFIYFSLISKKNIESNPYLYKKNLFYCIKDFTRIPLVSISKDMQFDIGKRCYNGTGENAFKMFVSDLQKEKEKEKNQYMFYTGSFEVRIPTYIISENNELRNWSKFDDKKYTGE